ncbi:MAG: amidase [Burkholderiaceae bacterium]|jgi:aspartyl-tRNA(Asn)/glutamyl-tRNA(Gln) amidotransferase subunit A|nr:amidase [Burkholderiaceae bacterium]MDP4968654.1 amidase [Burkholderiaceae bacterium]
MSQFEQLDLVSAADGIAKKAFSSTELTTWALNRLETIGRRFNAVFRIDHEQALARARALDDLQASGMVLGPLHGVPLAHKDLIEVEGKEMHVGSKIMKGNIANKNAWVINTLDAAGQVNLGALHMAEFAMSPTGFNGHYGHGLNPWNPEYPCGGSSSGSGIAVAARLVFGSLGSDTGGSIRQPAFMCGVTGIKPTTKRVSIDGVFPLSHTLDCVGPLAQSARDCARLLTHISLPNPDDPWCTAHPNEDYEKKLTGDLRGIRIGVPQDFYRENLDPEMAAALEDSLQVLRGRGAELVEVKVPDMLRIHEMTAIVLTAEAGQVHQKWFKERPQDYSDQVRARIEPGFIQTGIGYVDALRARDNFIKEYLATSLGSCDALHIPVARLHMPTIAATTSGDLNNVLQSISQLTYTNRAINYLGLPAMSVPAGFSSRQMPLAFQLVGKPFDEGMILNIADAYQRDTAWHKARPSV